MKELKITPPEGYIIDEEKSTIYNIVFKKKNELPTTWEEFCEQHKDPKLEFYITNCSEIVQTSHNMMDRRKKQDRNLLSTKEDAEAHLALIQLHRLRDVYRQGWVPDWKNLFKPKFTITQFFNKAEVVEVKTANTFLSFQSKEIAEQFLENFKDLIEEAKELI